MQSGEALAAPDTHGRKAAMATLARVRDASVQVAKVQRRIWLIQTIFWPLITIAGVVVAFVVARSVWQRRTASHVAQSEPARLNPAASGN
jgi:hypothetical protein